MSLLQPSRQQSMGIPSSRPNHGYCQIQYRLQLSSWCIDTNIMLQNTWVDLPNYLVSTGDIPKFGNNVKAVTSYDVKQIEAGKKCDTRGTTSSTHVHDRALLQMPFLLSVIIWITISQHQFSKWPGVKHAACHYLNHNAVPLGIRQNGGLS